MVPPIKLITDNATLESCINHLHTASEIAIDLEFDKNYYRFGFNLCLVQIFSGEICFLIDPLSDELEIETLFPVLENPHIQKVCFSFDEDLRLLHSLGCFPKNLYDIGIASRLLNYPSISLTNILIEELNIDPGSSSQLSNWFTRPLSSDQKNYAANDVLHLLKLKSFIDRKAADAGIQPWIEEENQALDKLNYSDLDHNTTIKEKDKQDFTEYEWHQFKKLMLWRNETAKSFNKPPFQIISKNHLANIAKDSRALMKWKKTRGIYNKIKTDDVKDELLSLLQEGAEEAERLHLSKEKPAQKSLSKEEYRQLADQKAEISKAKKLFFDPIKEKIQEQYGSETASFLLSNRIIQEIITGENGPMQPYKKKLILGYCKELNIDPSALKTYV